MLVSELVEERRQEDEEGGCFHKLRDEEHDKLTELLDMLFPEDADAEAALTALLEARIAESMKTIDSGEIKLPASGG